MCLAAVWVALWGTVMAEQMVASMEPMRVLWMVEVMASKTAGKLDN